MRIKFRFKCQWKHEWFLPFEKSHSTNRKKTDVTIEMWSCAYSKKRWVCVYRSGQQHQIIAWNKRFKHTHTSMQKNTPAATPTTTHFHLWIRDKCWFGYIYVYIKCFTLKFSTHIHNAITTTNPWSNSMLENFSSSFRFSQNKKQQQPNIFSAG